MGDRTDAAVKLFTGSFNCSEAVFAAFRDASKLDERDALKLATVFGAGVACTGNSLCGAVSGGLLAISMKYGRPEAGDEAAKKKTYELGRKFMKDFEGMNGSCDCEKILGMNIGTPENLEKARQQGLFGTKCLSAVKSAAELLEDLI